MQFKETYFDKLNESDLDQFRFLISLHRASPENTIFLEKLIPYLSKLSLDDITPYLPDLLTKTSFLNMKVAEDVTLRFVELLLTLLKENPTEVYQLPENYNKAAFLVGLGNVTSYFLDYVFNATDVKINDVEIGNKLKENIPYFLRFFSDYLTDTAIATINRLLSTPTVPLNDAKMPAITAALTTREDYAETLSNLCEFDYEERIQILANYYDSPIYSEMNDLSDLIDASDNARYLLWHNQGIPAPTIPLHALFMPGEDFYYPYFPYTVQKLSTFLPMVFTAIENMGTTPTEKILTKMRILRYLENMKQTIQLAQDDITCLEETNCYKETHALYEELLQSILKATTYDADLSFTQFSNRLQIRNYEFQGENYPCDTLLLEGLFYYKLTGAAHLLSLSNFSKANSPYYEPTYVLLGLHLELLGAYKRSHKTLPNQLFHTSDIRGIAASIEPMMLAKYYTDENVQNLTATYATNVGVCFTETISTCLKNPVDDVRNTIFYTSVFDKNLALADQIFGNEKDSAFPYKESLLSENISSKIKARICTHYALTAFTYALLLFYPSLETTTTQATIALEKLFMNLSSTDQHTISKIIVSYLS